MKLFNVLVMAGLAAAVPSNLVPRDVKLILNPKPTISAAEKDLIAWSTTAVFQVFPNHTGWDVAYDKYFDPSLVATFASPNTPAPETKYTFTTFKQFWTVVNQQITTKLKSLEIELVDTVALPFPNDPKSGMIYFSGLEQGRFPNGTRTYATRDGLFAIVKNINGTRKFTEWREATNFYTG